MTDRASPRDAMQGPDPAGGIHPPSETTKRTQPIHKFVTVHKDVTHPKTAIVRDPLKPSAGARPSLLVGLP